MIKKCEHLNCTKAGNCRCPKDRSLKEYWYFCQQHAGEYNKNWNYYSGMTAEEINKEWEKDVFGATEKQNGKEYTKFIFDFVSGQTKVPERKKLVPQNVAAAFNILGLSIEDDWDKVQKKYRALAKQEHPDANKSADSKKFIKISEAYQALKKHFKK
jgi:hypothetical protein